MSQVVIPGPVIVVILYEVYDLLPQTFGSCSYAIKSLPAYSLDAVDVLLI